MIELNVSKITDVDGASFYKLSPSVIKFGALNDEKVNKIHVNVPEELSGLTRRLSFTPAKKGLESFAMLLDDTGDIDVTRGMTEATGVITFDAFGEDFHVHTNDIQWTIITHSPVSNGSEPEYTPTQVEQILEQAQSKVNEAQSFANSASTSANTSAGAAALATELATSAQRSAEAAANSRSLAAMNADASMAFSNKAEQEADRAEAEADRSKSEADRSGAIANGIRTEYTGAFSEFKEEYTTDFSEAKLDILHYRNEAEQFATEAKQDYTTVTESVDNLTEFVAENIVNFEERLSAEETQRIVHDNQLHNKNVEQDKELDVLNRANEDVTYANTSDSTLARVKELPNNVLPYGTLDVLGGMSRKGHQLLNVAHSAGSAGGVSVSWDGQKITVNGTAIVDVYTSSFDAIGNATLLKQNGTYIPAGTYTFSINTKLPANVFAQILSTNGTTYTSGIFGALGDATSRTVTTTEPLWIAPRLNITNGITINMIIEFMVERGSVAHSYEPYTTELISAPVTDVEVNGTHKEIPTAIRNLNGYGLGINENCYNYVDFVNKKYHRRCEQYTVSGNEHIAIGQHTNGQWYASLDSVINAKTGGATIAGICNLYEWGTWSNQNGRVYCPNGKGVVFCDSRFTTLANATSILSAEHPSFVYELAEEEIVDISAYFDNSLTLEPNGSITYHYPNDDVYAVDVPSVVSYKVKKNVVNDVLVNNASVVNNGVATIPYARKNVHGTIMSDMYGFYTNTYGQPYAFVFNKTTYNAQANESFVSKGTLNNVLADYEKKSEWVLKGTITTENKASGITVDLTGCTELFVRSTMTATEDIYLTAFNSNRLLLNIGTSGARKVIATFADECGAIICTSSKYTSILTNDALVGNVNGYTTDNASISSITDFKVSAPSSVTSCNISIYAR